ncbi:hypothetical protein PIB30_010666 [Stylosanthes scabra]|uniref:Hyccin n=1 Tax=Stylosanthes scabra TaxID=79078 RepID=A0ABU6V4S1_9FABA|nr:hypothetical protein [Stylosanthes scabra]
MTSSSSSSSSDDENSPKTARTSATTTSTTTAKPATTNLANSDQIKSALQSLSSILSSPLPSHDPSAVYLHISALLRRPNSGTGDNNLCCWLYNTFQSNVPDLQLLVLRFLPLIAGLYLCRIHNRQPNQAGFEPILLAIYAHETASRAAQPVTVTLPDLSHPSPYYDSKTPPPSKSSATDLNLAVVSSTLEPHGAVRSTRRARIVGVALELFFSKISSMPVESKVDFCEFCKIWAGQDGSMYKYFEEEGITEIKNDVKEKEKGKGKGKGGGKKGEETAAAAEGRIPMPWELTQPVVRILAHCLMEPGNRNEAVFAAANEACRCLFARSMHDVNPMAILAMRSLLRLSKTLDDDFDPTELPFIIENIGGGIDLAGVKRDMIAAYYLKKSRMVVEEDHFRKLQELHCVVLNLLGA